MPRCSPERQNAPSMASGSLAAARKPDLGAVLLAVFGQRNNDLDVVYNINDVPELTIREAIEAHLNMVGTPKLIAGLWTPARVTRALRAHPWYCGKAHNVHGGGCKNLFVLSEGVPGEGTAGLVQ